MAQATHKQANLFELDCDGTHVTYSASSIQGKPLLDYEGPEGELHFSGDEIDRDEGTLGTTEVTVTLVEQDDGDTTALTLLLASFELPASNEAAFDTIAIKTTSHTTIAGPPEGPAQSYEAVALHGVAKAVVF